MQPCSLTRERGTGFRNVVSIVRSACDRYDVQSTGHYHGLGVGEIPLCFNERKSFVASPALRLVLNGSAKGPRGRWRWGETTVFRGRFGRWVPTGRHVGRSFSGRGLLLPPTHRRQRGCLNKRAEGRVPCCSMLPVSRVPVSACTVFCRQRYAEPAVR